MTTTTAKARALVEAAEKAEKPDSVPDDDEEYIFAAYVGGSDIASAYLEAVEMLRQAADVLEREEYHRSAALIREWLSKHDTPATER